MRLICADALLATIDLLYMSTKADRDWMAMAITHAPTVQREGWVSVPIEPTFEMKELGAIETKEGERKFLHRACIAENIYKAMIQAAPTLRELNEVK